MIKIDKIGKISKNFISLFIVLSTIIFVFGFKPLYYFDIDHLKIEEKSQYSKELIKESYDYVVDYTLGLKDSEFEIPNLNSSENGTIHFIEVRNLVQNIIKLNFLFGLASILGIYYCVRKKYHKILLEISLQVILIPVFLALPFAINFSKSFEIFHKIFFRNDYWIFDERFDPIIKILPEEFFFHAGSLILLLLTLISILSLTIYINKKTQKNNYCSIICRTML